MKSTATNQLPLPLLYRSQSTNLAIGATVRNQKFRVLGYRRVVGNFHVSTAAAGGFPRIRQSADGVNWSNVTVINVDPSQSNFQYPFDVEIILPYISVEYTQGAALSTFIYCFAQALPY